MVTVTVPTHNRNMCDFEDNHGINSDVWSFEQGEDFANFIIDKYELASFDNYVVDTDCDMSDYEADCLTLGHSF